MRILTIILLLFVCNFSFSQTFINRAGPANTVIDARLGASQNFYLPRLTDTTLSGGKDSIGNLIYDRLRAKIWIRDTILLGGHKFTQLFKEICGPYSFISFCSHLMSCAIIYGKECKYREKQGFFQVFRQFI